MRRAAAFMFIYTLSGQQDSEITSYDRSLDHVCSHGNGTIDIAKHGKPRPFAEQGKFSFGLV